MPKYIKTFSNSYDYDDFAESQNFIMPNVSYVSGDTQVYYNPLPYYVGLYYNDTLNVQQDLCFNLTPDYDNERGYCNCEGGKYRWIQMYSAAGESFNQIKMNMFYGFDNIDYVNVSVDGSAFNAFNYTTNGNMLVITKRSGSWTSSTENIRVQIGYSVNRQECQTSISINPGAA